MLCNALAMIEKMHKFNLPPNLRTFSMIMPLTAVK